MKLWSCLRSSPYSKTNEIEAKVVMKKTIFVVVCLIIIMIFTHCIRSPSEEYQPKLYTKEELLTVYEVNKTLFQDVVNVIIHNENFCNDRDSEYDDSFFCYQ